MFRTTSGPVRSDTPINAAERGKSSGCRAVRFSSDRLTSAAKYAAVLREPPEGQLAAARQAVLALGGRDVVLDRDQAHLGRELDDVLSRRAEVNGFDDGALDRGLPILLATQPQLVGAHAYEH